MTHFTQLPVRVKHPRVMQMVEAGWLGRDGGLMTGLVDGGLLGFEVPPPVHASHHQTSFKLVFLFDLGPKVIWPVSTSEECKLL